MRDWRDVDLDAGVMNTNGSSPLSRNGIAAAPGAVLLFGAATPAAKWLLGSVGPWMLAGLLYLGSGLGLMLWRRLVRAPRVQLPSAEWRWFAEAIR